MRLSGIALGWESKLAEVSMGEGNRGHGGGSDQGQFTCVVRCPSGLTIAAAITGHDFAEGKTVNDWSRCVVKALQLVETSKYSSATYSSTAVTSKYSSAIYSSTKEEEVVEKENVLETSDVPHIWMEGTYHYSSDNFTKISMKTPGGLHWSQFWGGSLVPMEEGWLQHKTGSTYHCTAGAGYDVTFQSDCLTTTNTAVDWGKKSC